MACRTSTAILCVQCGVPDLNRDQRACQKISQKECRKEVQKECLRKDVRKNVQKYVRKNVRKKWGELEVVADIISMMFDSQLSPLQV